MRWRGRILPAALTAALAALPSGTGRHNGRAHGVRTTAVTDDSLSGAGGTAPAPDRPEPPPTGRNGERGEDAGTGRPEAGAGSGTGPDAVSGTGPGVGSGVGSGTGPAVGLGNGPGIGSGTGPGFGSAAGPGVGSPAGPGTGAGTDRGTPRRRLRAWAELLRVSALFSVPGDALAGAAAVSRRPGRGTALAIGASLCLYEAGMALNDWADRDEDAIDRPHRPIPSGRISPAAALGAAGALTAAGLALAARAGRPALTVASCLAATVWAYDLHLKHTKAGPAAMAAARSLDLLLGATATATVGAGPRRGGRPDNVAGAIADAIRTSRPVAAAPPPPARGGLTEALPALPAALVLGAHTYGVTAVSRHEAQGGSTGTPLAVLATTTALAAAVLGEWRGRSADRAGAGSAHSVGTSTAYAGAGSEGAGRPGRAVVLGSGPHTSGPLGSSADSAASPALAARLEGLPGRAADPTRLLTLALTGAYLRTAGPPLLHAALNPSPPLTQRAVGGGIRAMIPLQAALAARAGAPLTGLAVMGLVPLARSLARKVSLT